MKINIFVRDRDDYLAHLKPLDQLLDDLAGFVEQLKARGVSAEPVEDDGENGWFTWITDPEGNRIELYQPYPV